MLTAGGHKLEGEDVFMPTHGEILPLGALVFFTLGYASVTTLSVGIFAILIFLIRVLTSAPGASWMHVLYGVLTLLLLVWALRPNLKKLMNGTERVVSISLHGQIRERKEQKQTAANHKPN